jgi:uncharacterized membrane protein YccC
VAAVVLAVTVAGGGAAARLCTQEATNKTNAGRRIIRRRDNRAAARAASAIANAPGPKAPDHSGVDSLDSRRLRASSTALGFAAANALSPRLVEPAECRIGDATGPSHSLHGASRGFLGKVG